MSERGKNIFDGMHKPGRSATAKRKKAYKDDAAEAAALDKEQQHPGPRGKGPIGPEMEKRHMRRDNMKLAHAQAAKESNKK